MRHTYQQLQQAIRLDTEMATLRSWFTSFPDKREANRSFSLPDVLTSAYAMFTLKYPSRLAFEIEHILSDNERLLFKLIQEWSGKDPLLLRTSKN